MQSRLIDRGVHVIGGDLVDAYRRLPDVLRHHADTIRIEQTLRPIVMIMAGSEVFDPSKVSPTCANSKRPIHWQTVRVLRVNRRHVPALDVPAMPPPIATDVCSITDPKPGENLKPEPFGRHTEPCGHDRIRAISIPSVHARASRRCLRLALIRQPAEFRRSMRLRYARIQGVQGRNSRCSWARHCGVAAPAGKSPRVLD